MEIGELWTPHEKTKHNRAIKCAPHTPSLRVPKNAQEEPYCSRLAKVPSDAGTWADSNTDQDIRHPFGRGENRGGVVLKPGTYHVTIT